MIKEKDWEFERKEQKFKNKKNFIVLPVAYGGGRKGMSVALYSEINFICIILLLIIVLKYLSAGFKKQKKDKLFFGSVLLTLFANVFDFLWEMTVSGVWNVPVVVMWAINFLYFFSFGASAFCLFLYTESVYKKKIFGNKIIGALYVLPFAALVALLIATAFNGCLFYFDADKVYHRGNLFYLQQILSYGYVVYASVKCFFRSFNKKFFSKRDESLTLASFVFLPLVFGIIQINIQSIPVLSTGIVISYLLVFINSLENLISSDSLTGIMNRREFVRKLADSIKSLKENEDLFLIFIDIDEFKYVNDEFGHNEGDKLLKAVALGLDKFTRDINGYCCRYGGDEFAVVHIIGKDENKEEYKARFAKFIKERGFTAGDSVKINLSSGYSRYRGEGDSIPDLIERADEEMYKVKHTKADAKAQPEGKFDAKD